MRNNLRELREMRRLTREGLAEQSGVDYTVIAGIENGTLKLVSSKALLRLAEALHTTVEYIFFGE